MSDDFSDGELSNDPAWTASNASGDGMDFQISEGELQSNGPTASSTVWISTDHVPDLFSGTIVWTFYVRYDFPPSSSNSIEIFVASDQGDLTDNPQGYFIRLGEGGSNDGVDFYKTTSATPLIADPNPSVAGGIDATIRLTREESGTWTLEADMAGGSAFDLIGTANDTEPIGGIHFGFKVKHTSTRNQSFFFDNVSVTSTDNSPPALSGVEVSSEVQLKVTFSEEVDPATAEMAPSYQVNNGIGSPLVAEVDAANPRIVELTFPTPFANAESYELTVTDVEDFSGNVITSTSYSFFYFQEEQAVVKDILIYEILADPTPVNDLPEREYIEIYNNSNKIFNLEGWSFSDLSSTATMDSSLLFPGNFLILCAASDVDLFEPLGSVMGLSTWPTLNNGGDLLSLKAPGGVTIDSVKYSSGWHRDATKAEGGWSLELINPANQCHTESNWAASTDISGGTPGRQNAVFDNTDRPSPKLLSATALNDTIIELVFSEPMEPASIPAAHFSINDTLFIQSALLKSNLKEVVLTLSSGIVSNTFYAISAETLENCNGIAISDSNTAEFILVEGVTAASKDIVINEILANPTPPNDLPEVEFVEIYNNSDKVFNLGGWFFSDASSGDTLGTRIFSPGDFLILCASSDVDQFEPFGNVLGLTQWPTLNNPGDLLYLKDPDGVVVDSVNYTNGWHGEGNKAEGGWSLELINPANQCHAESNWTASTDISGGTPGRENTVFDEAADTAPPQLRLVTVLNDSTLQLEFDEPLNAAMLGAAGFTLNEEELPATVALINSLTLELTFPSSIEKNRLHTIVANHIPDCSGNIGSNLAGEFILVENGVVSKKDIIFNEIFPHPNGEGELPDAEYVELFNRSENIFDLNGWSFSDAGSTATIPPLVIFPGEYVILCKDTEVHQMGHFGRVHGVASWPALNNSGDALVLKDAEGLPVDSLYYDASWYNSSSKASGGWALELIDPDNLCSDRSNWAASEDYSGGTPGRGNTIFADQPDLTGPELVEVLAWHPDSITVTFNEILDPERALTADYVFDHDIKVTKVEVEDHLRAVKLALSEALEGEVMYRLTVTNLTDCNGNKIGDTNTAEFALIEPADSTDVVINEVLFNPRPGGVDFVEVYNRSKKYINLKGWLLANDQDGAPGHLRLIAGRNHVLQPGRYLSLTTDGIILKEQYPLGEDNNFLEMKHLPSYPDDTGTVILLRDDSIQIDRLTYDENFHFELLSDHEGVSLERVSSTMGASATANWKSAASTAGFATPGYLNSQSRKDIDLTDGDIKVDPKIIIPDGSGQKDFATISYSFSQPGFVANVRVLDVDGRTIKKLGENDYLSAEGFYTWDGTDVNGGKARIGYYLIYFEVFNLDGEILKFKERVVVGSRF